MTNIPNIDSLFQKIEKLRVLIVGDVMVDEYMWGSVDRISPEAPVPVLNVQKREIRLGGAANVALNILALGAEPVLCGYIGDDASGEKFLEELKTKNISSDCIHIIPKRKTTTKTRIIGHTQHILRADSEQTDEPAQKEQKIFLDKVVKKIPACNVVVLEDYDKGALNAEIIQSIIHHAKKHSIPVAVDPKFRNFMRYHGCTLLKPNLKEISDALHITLHKNDLDKIKTAVVKMMNELKNKFTLLTLGETGALATQGRKHAYIPAHVREVMDVSGAGDTVISVASLLLALNLPFTEIAELSNVAGGLVCEHVGVAPVNKNEFRRELLKLRNERE